jgi:DNA-directed RNA polymerase subunit beta'
MKGEGMTFYSPEEVIIAYNEKRLDLHTDQAALDRRVTARPDDRDHLRSHPLQRSGAERSGSSTKCLPRRRSATSSALVVKETGMARAAQFLDDIKDLGFMSAFRGGLSFNLDDVVIPDAKEKLVKAAQAEVDEVTATTTWV